MGLAEVFQKLEDVSKRLTPQREKIIRIFAESPGQTFSAEEVRQLLRAGFGEVGLATVYRTLDLLTDLNVLVRETVGDGRAHYQLPPAKENRRRPSMVCMRCGATDPISQDQLDSIDAWAVGVLDFHLVEYELTLYGTCRVCYLREHRRRNGHESIS